MANLLSLPFTFVIVSYVFIPVFMQTRVTSAYELLEARLGLGIRLLGAVMFLVLQLLFMSMLLLPGGQGAEHHARPGRVVDTLGCLRDGAGRRNLYFHGWLSSPTLFRHFSCWQAPG